MLNYIFFQLCEREIWGFVPTGWSERLACSPNQLGGYVRQMIAAGLLTKAAQGGTMLTGPGIAELSRLKAAQLPVPATVTRTWS